MHGFPLQTIPRQIFFQVSSNFDILCAHVKSFASKGPGIKIYLVCNSFVYTCVWAFPYLCSTDSMISWCTVDCTCIWTCACARARAAQTACTNMAGQSMKRTVEYPGSWSVFVNGQGMNVVNLGNHSQEFQGMVGSPAASQAGSSDSVPDLARSYQLVTAVANLPSSSSIKGASITSRSTQVATYYIILTS